MMYQAEGTQDRTEPKTEDVTAAILIPGPTTNRRGITRIIYPYRRIDVKAVLTHREYDRDNWKVKLCREYTSD
jgi:mRNA-degrading endonuclease HigB of HigAB toxin-antitoxin module